MKSIIIYALFVTSLHIAYAQSLDHSKWDALLQKFVSDDGRVNYKGFLSHKNELDNYIKNLSENPPAATWSKNKTLAYWINAYNALTIDLILRHYPVKSIKDIKNPWKQKLWTLGNKTYNLDTIEHDILRKMNEPRIHFAIVCASYSCPKLSNNAYTEDNINNELTEAAKCFLEDNTRNNITASEIKLSKIFKWFASDFKQNSTLIEYLNNYSKVAIKSDANKSYLDYNWDLNE